MGPDLIRFSYFSLKYQKVPRRKGREGQGRHWQWSLIFSSRTSCVKKCQHVIRWGLICVSWVTECFLCILWPRACSFFWSRQSKTAKIYVQSFTTDIYSRKQQCRDTKNRTDLGMLARSTLKTNPTQLRKRNLMTRWVRSQMRIVTSQY